MHADKFPMRGDDAAEILRPRPVKTTAHDNSSDLLVAQLLRIGGEGHQGVDLAVREELLRLGRGVSDEIYLALGVDADMRRHGRCEDMMRRSQFGHGNRLSSEIANRFHALGPEQL